MSQAKTCPSAYTAWWYSGQLKYFNIILRGSEKTLPKKIDRKNVRQRYYLLLDTLNEFEDQNESYEMPNEVSIS